MAKNEPKNEMVKHEEAGAAMAIPEYLQQSGPVRGLDDMEQQDRALPRLAISQAMSNQIKRSDPSYVSGLEIGQFFNTITKKVYGPTCMVVPLMFFKNRIRFRKRNEGGGILCQAVNNRDGVGDPGGECAICPLAQFQNSNPPECTNFFNYAAIIVPDGKTRPRMDDLAVISFKSAAIKAAKSFNTLLSLRGTDPFKGVYKFTITEMTNQKGTFYVPVIENAGWIGKEVLEDFEKVFSMMDRMHRSQGIKFDAADLERDADPAGEAN